MVWLKRLFLFSVILVVFLVPVQGGVSYSSNEDVVLENEKISLLFSLKDGNIFLHSKEAETGEKVEIILLDDEGTRASSIYSTEILKNSENKVTLEVSFLTRDNRLMRQVFSLDKGKRWVEIKPRENAGAVQVHARTRFSIIPAFGEHDLVFNPRSYSVSRLLLPSENIILNLLNGEERMVIITWPDGKQRVSAFLSGEGEKRFIEATEVTFAKQSVYVGILAAAGIWHEVKLAGLPHLKDLALDWRKPFPASWKANFYAERRSSSIKFRTRFTRWLPEQGSFVWPCWFDNEKAFFHLNKRVLEHRDIALVYPSERDKTTPARVDTPADILKQTLGDKLWNHIQARNLLLLNPWEEGQIPLQGEPWPGERPAIAWGCSAFIALERLFERGLVAEQTFFVDPLVNGVLDTVDHTLRQLKGFRLSTPKIVEFMSTTKKDNPSLIPFLERMEDIIREMKQELENRFYTPWLNMIGRDALWKESRTAVMEYTLEVGERIKRLAREEGNLEKLSEFRILHPQLGFWMNEAATAVYRRQLGNLAQEAIIVAAESGEPEVMKAAEEIRRLALKARRNPGWGF